MSILFEEKKEYPVTPLDGGWLLPPLFVGWGLAYINKLLLAPKFFTWYTYPVIITSIVLFSFCVATTHFFYEKHKEKWEKKHNISSFDY